MVSSSLWTFCPYIIGHGSLSTCDVPGAAVGALAGYLFWRWLQRPGGLAAVLCGVAWGLALLTKTTWLILTPVWFLTAYAAVRGGTASRTVALADTFVVVCVTLLVLNGGYGLHGTGIPLGEVPLKSRLLAAVDVPEIPTVFHNRFTATWAGAIPIPVPDDFLRGCDLQADDLEHIRGGYMAGTESPDGRCYYIFYAIRVKLPDATLLLCILSVLSGSAQVRQAWLPLLAGSILLLTVVLKVRMDDHSRYAIPALPFLFVWLGSVAADNHRRSRLRGSIAAVLCISGMISTLAATPHTLAFANQISGGRAGLHRHLLGSEYDWGQDLVALKRWSDTKGVDEPIKLLYCGLNDPSVYGIRWSFPTQLEGLQNGTLSPGWYAVSPNVLYRDTGFKVFRNPLTTEELVLCDVCRRLRERPPDFIVGAGMRVYRVEESGITTEPVP